MPSGSLSILFLTIFLGDAHLEVNGSDKIQMSIPRKSCGIPTFGDYYYLSLEGNKLDPEKCYDGSGKFAVRVICFNPTKMIEPDDFAICFDGEWYPSAHTCVQRKCEPVHDTFSTHHTCLTPKGVEVDCRRPAVPGTKITIQCAHWRYKFRISRVIERFCQISGQWQTLEECKPVCGLVFNDTRSFIENNHKIRGDDTILSTILRRAHDFPWNAIIYRYNDGEWNQTCVGTVISEFLIVTAENCFPNDIIVNENIKVVVGNYSKNYTDYNQNLVHDVIKVDSYKQHSISILAVKKYIEFSDTVGPACLIRPGASLVQDIIVGNVITWGEDRKHITTQLQCDSHRKCKTSAEVSGTVLSDPFFCCMGKFSPVFFDREQLGGGLVMFEDQDEFHHGVVLIGVLVELLNDGRLPIYLDLGSDHIRLFLHKYIEKFYDWLNGENKYWFRRLGEY